MSEGSTSGSPSVVVDASRPWLGLLPFKEAHKGFFFGRDAEITEILSRIGENTLTVLFGQSGLGKSSLLAAGVLPQLRGAGFQPELVRLDYADGAPTLLQQTRRAIGMAVAVSRSILELRESKGNDENPTTWDEIPLGILGENWDLGHERSASSTTLWELFHYLPLYVRPEAPTPVIIFDQFEEIFTLGRQDPAREAEAEEWLEQMADLLQNRPPRTLEERFAENRKLARGYDFGRCPLRVVFALREDYLSHLEQWKGRLPLLTQNRMALNLLDGPQALEAVLGPASLAEIPLLGREVAGHIVRTVARVPADTPLIRIKAVPPLLSLLCEQLNAARLAAAVPEITTEMVSDQSADILQRFYEECYEVFPPDQREIIREIVEDRMVTIGGHRHPVAREDAEAELLARGISEPAAVFDALIAHRLLTAEEHAGIQRLEVTHDVLVPLLVRSRKERRDRVAKELAERKLAEERALTRKRRQLLAGAGLLTLLAMAGAIYGFLSAREAASQRDEARFNEGLGWMLRAEVAQERKSQYPDTLLYAAQAIGFEGVGRPADAPDSLLRFIRRERNAEAYQKARDWIAGRPAYLPVWSTAAYPAAATGLDVSADGRHLALATADGAVRLWDLREQTMREIRSPDGQAAGLVFDPVGDRLATLGGKDLRLHKLADGPVVSREDDAAAMDYSPDGEVLATALKNGNLHLWRGSEATLLETGMKEPATAITFSADNSRAAAVFPGGVRVFFPYYGALAHAWAGHQEISSASAIRPDGARLAVGTRDGEIVIHDSASAAVLGRCSGEQRHEGVVAALAYRPDGRQLASASADGTVRLWDISRDIPTVTATLRGHAGGIVAVCYFPGGELLATAGADGSARIWNVGGGSMESPDLYHYLAAGWYRIDPRSQEAQWSGGEGAANVPPDSLLGRQRAGADVLPYLATAGAWNGLTEGADLPPALMAAADAAAKEGKWRTLDLRLAQMRRLKISLDTVQKFTRMQEYIATPEKPYRNPEGIELIWCKPGTFLMGSPEDESGRYFNETQHEVTLTTGFWLAKTELTQEQWRTVMGTNPSTYARSGPTAPVENVSWGEAMDYCRRLTDRERARGNLPPGWAYTLPTEAQWEYACRAGSATAYSFGNDPADLHKHGNYNDISGSFTDDTEYDDMNKFTALTGSFLPNNWGFHDMHGNVFEWCRDLMHIEDPDYAADPVENPIGSFGTHRVVRGGGFRYDPSDCRSAVRSADPSSYRTGNVGFRPAVSPLGQHRADEAGVSGSEPGGVGEDGE